MVHIILACHGDAALGMLSAAEMICGKQNNITALSLRPGMSAEQFGKLINDAVKQLGLQDEALVFTDFIGGTPSNQALRQLLYKENIEIITGLNLPMLLDAIFSRNEKTAGEMAKHCVNSGIQGVADLKANIKKRNSSTND